jgi:hypothetical protein
MEQGLEAGVRALSLKRPTWAKNHLLLPSYIKILNPFS